MINFNPQEIVKIAINVEENGLRLYEALANKAINEKSKAMWYYLKEQEEIHRKIFQDMLDNIGDYIIYEFTTDEYEAYLRAIASEYVFTSQLIEEKILELFASDIEAVDFGIAIEKESILVYSALAAAVLLEKQHVINKVIEEEKKHLVEFTLLKESLMDEKTDRLDNVG